VRYTDGTVNHWFKAERPGVFLQNGHVTAFSFAVTDVDKQYIVAGSGHDSKVIVIPFDGVTFDHDNPGPGSPGCPAEVETVDAGEADAAPPADAGSVVDTGVPVDAGSVVDASAAADARASLDGGGGVDSGGPDAKTGVTPESSDTDAGTVGESSSSGCSCRAGAPRVPNGAAAIAWLAGMTLLSGRRRRARRS
jgi:hypothetical protein